MGCALVVTVYFSVAKLIQSSDLSLSFDVDEDLRNRLPTQLGFKDVSALIGMIQFDQSVNRDTKFWDLVQSLYD